MVARRARLLSANTHTGGYLLLSFFAPVQVGTFFLTVAGKYLSLTITEQEATFLGNFDVLFNNTVIAGYLR